MNYFQMGEEFTRTMKYLKSRFFIYFIGMIGMSLMLAVVPVIQAVMIKKMIEAAELKELTYLIKGIYLLILSLIVLCVLIPVFRYIYNASAKSTEGDLQIDVFRHRGTLPIRYFEKNHSGILLSRITNDVATMAGLYTGRLRRLIAPTIYGLTAAVPMFYLDWRIALGLFVLNILSLFINTIFTKTIRHLSKMFQQALSKLSSQMVDILEGFTIIKLFGIQKLILNKYVDYNRVATGYAIERERKSAYLDGLNYFISIVSTLFVMMLGAWLVSIEQTTFGTLFAILFLQLRLNRSFLEVGAFIPEVQSALASSERVFEFLDENREPDRYRVSKSNAGSHILFKDVYFGYEKNNKILTGVSFTIERGQTIGLIGESGGGKSTLFKILLGFYPIDSGQLVIDGKNFGEYTLKEIREKIAYVPQRPYLFNGTIKENIMYGKQDVSDKEVIDAAKAAFAHDFVTELTDGYDTMVGEQGNRLSGGQKQRIAIARAILKDSPILLLDEATSALDTESEYWVQKAIEELKKNRTTLCIAHRLSTLESANKIFVLKEGVITEKRIL